MLKVNGESFTKSDFTAALTLKDRVWRLRENKPLVCPAKEFADFEQAAGPSVLMEMIHHAMFAQYAREMGIRPAESNVAEAAARLLKVLNLRNLSVDEIADSIGGKAGELFRQIPYIDAQDILLRQSVTSNDLSHVSEAEIKARLDYVAQFDANADRLNGQAKERLLAAKKEILAGADFAEVAKRIPESVAPEFGKEWGTFEIQEFAGEEDLYKWLKTAKEGDISDPVDVPDGLTIVKILKKGKGEAPPGQEPPDSFTMVRCTVRAFEKMRYQDRAEMTQQLLLWKQEDAQRKLGTMLTSRAVIEYPHGTNLFKRVSSRTKEKTDE